MKIRLAILDEDKNYLGRFVNTFSVRYSDKVEIYSFTNPDTALDSLAGSKTDVFLAHEDFEIDESRLPRRCVFARLSEGNNVSVAEGRHIVGKYQRVELLYKAVLSLYAECVSAGGVSASGDGQTFRTLLFASPCGGAGGSTMAAACAMSLAAAGRSVLYLNGEVFSGADDIFPNEGGETLSDILYAIKSGKSSIYLKLESAVRKDKSGVDYYAPCAYPQDVISFTKEDVETLFAELFRLGKYEYVVCDVPFILCELFLELARRADWLVMTGDGSDVSNRKLLKGVDTLRVAEDDMGENLLGKLMMVYNRFSSSFGQQISIPDVELLGGVPRIQSGSTREIAETIAREKSSVFEKVR